MSPKPDALARIPFGHRASLAADLAIAAKSLLGALLQLWRSRRGRARRGRETAPTGRAHSTGGPLPQDSMPAEQDRPMPPGTPAAFWIMALTVVAMIAYWGIWFFVDRDWLATSHAPEYYAFENAFPLADGFMTLVSLLGAIALKRRRPEAMLWMILGGGASLYLGFMDVLYDLEHGIYLAPTGDWGGVVVEILVNLATLLAGGWIVRFAWRNRNALLGS